MLLSEIHHRVKNNLTLFSSMLQLENFQAENEDTHKVLQNSQLRIQSMAAVHEEVYNTQDFNNLPFREIVSTIISTIQSVCPMDWPPKGRAVGFTLVETLVQQLEAAYQISSVPGKGTDIAIVFRQSEDERNRLTNVLG